MDDLISEFIAETTEGLALLDQELLRLEQNPGDEGTLGNIFRIVHTIKGTCGFLGLPRLESVAHASENVLGKIRDKKLEATQHAVSLVLESLDNIKGLIDYLSSNGQEPAGDDTALIARLNHYADTGTLMGEGAPAPKADAHAAAPASAEAPAEEEAGDFSSFFKGDDDLNALIAAQGGGHGHVPAAPKLELLENKEEAPAPAPKPAAAAPAAAPKEDKESAAAAQSIRVNLDVLENLMQMVSELVLTRNQLLQVMRTRDDREFTGPIQQLSHITSELQEGVMKTRMQPIGNAWSKFPRLIRDLSLELGKKIDLKMIGAETELDRQMLEMIKDPLTHMVRNSCDHGLESTADRKAAGKSETGTVTLSAYHEGGHIIIEIVDDGKGINVKRVREKAIENGLASEAEVASLSDQQVLPFIFRAGFSTAEKVTSVSGRGVGMDVVRTNIEKIGGTIDLSSEMGKGSKFSIKIPLTLAIVSVLIVEGSGQRFAIPQINVLELVRVGKESEYVIESINGAPVMRLREKLLPLGSLGSILQMGGETNWSDREAFIVVCKVGGYDFGLIVDRVYDTEEIVVKPVAQVLKDIAVYSGNTILGDGNVIMILDPNGVARAIGQVDLGKSDQAEKDVRNDEDKTVSFLLFATGKGAPKAVPLELVARLEEIDVRDIEVAGDHPVVQYRGDLMRLRTMDDDTKIPDEGIIQVIVFTYDKKTVGLVVSEILDIVHAKYDVKLAAKEHNCLGSMVISGKTTDVVDVAQLLNDIIDPAQSEPAAAAREKAEHCNLLLIEDSPFFRNLTVPFLASAGYKVTAAENGQEAMKLLNANPSKFQIVVTDIEMPGMNGFEFTQAARAIPQMAHVPIIAYTASLSQEVMARGKSVGMNECIVKTDRPGLLKAVTHYVATDKELAA